MLNVDRAGRSKVTQGEKLFYVLHFTLIELMALSFLGGVLQKAEWFLYPAWRVLCVYRHQYIIYGARPP